MITTDFLNDLIAEGELLTTTISFVPSPPNVWRMNDVYKTNEPEKYQNWQSSVQRFINKYYPSDIADFKKASIKLNPDNHRLILGILKAIKLLPEEPVKNEFKPKSETSITIHNSQTNNQSVVLNLIIDTIKEEITGKELRELKELLTEYEKEPQKDKSKLKDKIKNFGTDVLTNMIANILTNPNIYSGLM